MLEEGQNELLAERRVLLHRALQINGAFRAGMSVENLLRAWGAATCVAWLCYPVGFRIAGEVTNAQCCSSPNLQQK